MTTKEIYHRIIHSSFKNDLCPIKWSTTRKIRHNNKNHKKHLKYYKCYKKTAEKINSLTPNWLANWKCVGNISRKWITNFFSNFSRINGPHCQNYKSLIELLRSFINFQPNSTYFLVGTGNLINLCNLCWSAS